MRANALQFENTVKINTVYDCFGNLIHLVFDKNKTVSKQLFKLIELFIRFHKFMTRITVNRGIDNQCLHELNKLVLLANITDVCLDNTGIRDGNYDLFLEDPNCTLKNLSMSRCKIDDAVVKRMAIDLRYPLPASKTLLILNLAANLITDAGANYLAEALRTNRQLVYLNLSDNNITDLGAQEIFDTLKDFSVTDEEMLALRHRKVNYMKERNALVNQIAEELKSTDQTSQDKFTKKKSVKPATITPLTASKKGNEKDLKTGCDKSSIDLDTIWMKKAKILADTRMGQFADPFSAEYVYFKDDETYCFGNNTLAYINVSYTGITYYTVKKIHMVLLTQQTQNRTPKGLVNVTLEGNLIPSKCRELAEIDQMLMFFAYKKMTAIQKPKK